MSLHVARPIASEVLETSDWVRAHEAVLAVAKERAGLERREGICLLRAHRRDVHRHLGYGAFAEYTDRHLGYCQRTTADKLRTAEALERLPELAQAQRDGRLNASVVRELARVATAATESAWIETAAGLRVREVERLVSGRAPGDHPSDAQRPELARHTLRFEVSAQTLAAFRDAMRCVAERTGHHLDDDAALLLIARAILDAPAPASETNPGAADADATPARTIKQASTSEHALAGRARYQISVIECPSCKRAFMPAGPDLLEIDAAIQATAHCDAQLIHAHAPLSAERRAKATHAGARKEATHVAAADVTSAASACRGSEATHGDAVSVATSRGDADEASHTLTAAVIGAAHASEETEATHVGAVAAQRSTRTTQSIPPAARRHVLARDHHCQIPGCRNTVVEVHHIVPRAEGGSNSPKNLIGICTVHHPAIHRGQLHVTGTADALDVRHADGTPYGAAVSATRSDTSEKVFRGLRWLGYKERDARAAIQAALLEYGTSSTDPLDDAGLLRRALAQLG